MLLPTTMSLGILNTAFRFKQDNAENALFKNTEHMTRDTGNTKIGALPAGSVGFPDTTYDYISITRSSKSPDGGVCDQFLQRGRGPHFMMVQKDLALMACP